MAQEDQVEVTLMESSDPLPDGIGGCDEVSGSLPDGPLTFQKRRVQANCEEDFEWHEDLRVLQTHPVRLVKKRGKSTLKPFLPRCLFNSAHFSCA